jgi:hypothetical protein
MTISIASKRKKKFESATISMLELLSELNGSCRETPPAPLKPIIALIERPTTRSEYYNSNPASTDGIFLTLQTRAT